MRKELDEKVLKDVAGGKYAVNKNTRCIYFETIEGEYKVREGMSVNDAIDEMDALIGKYSTENEYDAACLKKLTELGYF